MGAGLPFLASDCGNSAEIADWTQAGEIVESKQTKEGFTKVNIHKATSRLRALIENDKKRHALAANALKNRKNFVWPTIVDEYEKVFMKFAQSKK